MWSGLDFEASFVRQQEIPYGGEADMKLEQTQSDTTFTLNTSCMLSDNLHLLYYKNQPLSHKRVTGLYMQIKIFLLRSSVTPVALYLLQYGL